MKSQSRQRKASESRPGLSLQPRRMGAAFFALVLVALTAVTGFAQRQTSEPQSPARRSTGARLPAALASRVAVAHPIIGKGFATIPTADNKRARLQPLSTTERSQILQMAKGGKAQSGAGVALTQPLAGGNGFATIQGLRSNGAAKRSAPLTDPEKLMLFQYIESTAYSTPGPTTTFTKMNTNLILTPAAPHVEGRASLSYVGPISVQPSQGYAEFSRGGGELQVWINVPSTGLYVLNLTLSSFALPTSLLGNKPPTENTINISANDNFPQTLNIGAVQSQVAVPIQVSKANWWYQVKISSSTVNWTFYSCEVISAQ